MAMARRALWLVLAVMAPVAFAQAEAPTSIPRLGASGNATEVAAPIPDFSGVWRHTSLPWLAPPASGPGPVTNRSRRNGVSNYSELVGDYSSPILHPWAAEVVKRHGELSLAGITYPNPANQCWPEPLPFILKNNGMQMVQRPDEITIIYDENHQFRQVRLNAAHPVPLAPTWHGDSVGHYEGDTLVVDTVGTKVDRPFAMIDLFGTPFTEALHVVERYRLLDYEDAKVVIERDAKENFRPPGDIDPNYRGKYLVIDLTVEDNGAFTTPWSASVIYGRGSGAWQEKVCAENIRGDDNKSVDVPRASYPDF
jgi:hypothetical protein